MRWCCASSRSGDIFDLPVDGHAAVRQTARPADVIVPVTDRVVDLRVPLAGTLRVGRDQPGRASLAEVVQELSRRSPANCLRDRPDTGARNPRT